MFPEVRRWRRGLVDVWLMLVLPRFSQTVQTVLAVNTIIKYWVWIVFEVP